MKRLLVVLFGVLAFQGSVWAEGHSRGYECRIRIGSAQVLTPASDDSSTANKGEAFLLQWKDPDRVLGDNVKVTLQEHDGGPVPLSDPQLNKVPNTGNTLITKRSMGDKKIKTGEEHRYYFQIEKVGVARAEIKSGCFTFTDHPALPDIQCHGAQTLRECVKASQDVIAELRVQVEGMQERLDALEGGGGTVKLRGMHVPGDHKKVGSCDAVRRCFPGHMFEFTFADFKRMVDVIGDIRLQMHRH